MANDKSSTMLSDMEIAFNTLSQTINDLLDKPNVSKAINKVVITIQSSVNDLIDKFKLVKEDFISKEVEFIKLNSQQRSYDSLANHIVKTIDNAIANKLPDVVKIVHDVEEEIKQLEETQSQFSNASHRPSSRIYYNSDRRNARSSSQNNDDNPTFSNKLTSNQFQRQNARHSSKKANFHENHAVLITANEDKDNPNVKPKVSDILHDKIDPTTLKIASTVSFPSGSLLIKFTSKDDLDLFTSKVQQIDELSIKPQRTIDRQFRIHSVPNALTAEKLLIDVQQQLNETPHSIDFIQYRNEKSTGKLAIIKCSERLYQTARNTRCIRIGYDHFNLDCQIRIPRCSKCGLIGHPDKFCRNSTISPKNIAKDDHCLDCSFFNHTIRTSKLSTARLRPTRHQTNDRSCPTVRYYVNKVNR
ncbi:unnamed protein product [Allacma fusca]|uniref:Uncharacterized protein n=1 Tax=Allacma fusca TaxID=39272 RepID=A0A8J2JBL5_9HEXA|nr:unnamed protein product [Allacma fusca]